MTAVCCLRRNSDEGSLSLKVVNTAEELQQAFAIRSIVFMGEQRCPYNEEFDGNDFAATHILGLVDGEPAVTGRVRYFGEFVKFERFAVRPEFRDGLANIKIWS